MLTFYVEDRKQILGGHHAFKIYSNNKTHRLNASSDNVNLKFFYLIG